MQFICNDCTLYLSVVKQAADDGTIQINSDATTGKDHDDDDAINDHVEL